MNELEGLTFKNKENYERYLKRMSDSMSLSTKGIVPYFAKGGKNILDVGCGSGIMLTALTDITHDANLSGIDLNMEAIKKLQTLGNNWKLYHEDFLKFNKGRYDTIIFSSILHEISSYHEDANKRFTSVPIKEAFIKSNELLEDNGNIILRDGLLVPDNNKDNQLLISFTDPTDANWLYRFQNDFKGFDNLDCNKEILTSIPNEFLVSERFLKEFLYTYTWGASSYPREINERFGILTKDEWISLLYETGFEVEDLMLSKEEYEKYLGNKVNITDILGNKYEYPHMNILIRAKKVKSLKK